MGLYEEFDTAECPVCNQQGERYYYDCPAPFGTWIFSCACGFAAEKDLHDCVNDQMLDDTFAGGLVMTEFDLSAEAEAFRRKIDGILPNTVFRLTYLENYAVSWPMRVLDQQKHTVAPMMQAHANGNPQTNTAPF